MFERADHWTPPDSLGYSSLRPVRLTGQGKTLIVLAAVLVIGAVVLGFFLAGVARRQAAERNLLRAEGLTADATVTRAWIAAGKDEEHWIAYRFDYAGGSYTRRVQAPRSIWRGLSAGSPIQVRFAPSQPSVNHPVAWDARQFPLWLAWLLAGTGAALPFLLLIPVRRQARLLAEGRPAPARVTAVRNDGKFLVVQYEFHLLNGVVTQGKFNVHKAPAVGAPLCVLYDPENPRRNALYPLALVRLEDVSSLPR